MFLEKLPSEAIFIRLGLFEVSAFGSFAIIAMVVLAILMLAAHRRKSRS